MPEDLARMTVNLVMNACQAMAEKRHGAGNEYQPELTVFSEKSDWGVSILIRDNGTGMDTENPVQDVQPFFHHLEYRQEHRLGFEPGLGT